MKISIHMPAYNAEATIAAALQSLLRQRDTGQFDIIVVDDGSVDRTCDVVQALAETARQVRLIRNAHGGIAKARNAALRAMAPDTDLVGFLDADDLSPEGRFARDIDVFRTDPTLELVYSKIRFFEIADMEKLAPAAGSRIVDGRVVQLAAGLFRRELLDRVGLFDEGLVQSEDLDYWLRTFEQRPKYRLSEHIGVFYRKNHGGITEDHQQARHELMKALFRARKRRANLGNFIMPQGLLTADHVAELEGWVK